MKKPFQNNHRTSLTVTLLEDRTVPSVVSDLIENVKAVQPDLVTTGPIPGAWIAQFSGYTGYGPDQLTQVRQKLDRAGSGVQMTRWLGTDGLFMVSSSPDADEATVSRALAGMKGFVSVGQDQMGRGSATPNDGFYTQGKQSNLTQINAPAAWDINTGVNPADGKPRNVIAVLDTGIDYTHPDLFANMWRNPGEIQNDGIDNDGNGYTDDYYGYDFCTTDGTGYSSNPMDDNGHGTHVAGIAGAAGNNSLGTTGVSWGAQLMAVKILNSNNAGSLSDTVAGMSYVNMMNLSNRANVRVINASWEFSVNYSFPLPPNQFYDYQNPSVLSPLRTAIATSDTRGILFVNAAGNSGYNNDNGNGSGSVISFTYPAKYDLPNILVVAAVDSVNNRANFSNYGSQSVDLAAPGVGIWSTVVVPGTPGQATYTQLSGTSMAAPHAAGMAAMMFAIYDRGTVQDIKSDLIDSVTKVSSLNGLVLSGGVLNAGEAMKRTANRAFVEKLYTDVLQRPASWRAADQGGYNLQLNTLNAGTSRLALARGFTNSDERLNNLIQSFYKGYLGRPNGTIQADVDGWRNIYRANNLTIEQLRAKIIASDEFYTRSGNTTQFGYVQNLYIYVLGRNGGATPAEINNWVNFWNANSLTREQLALSAFLQSAEYQKNTIRGCYTNLAAIPNFNTDFLKTQLTPGLLRRPGGVSQAEVDYWYNYKVSNNVRTEEIEAMFINSNEYWIRVV